MEATFIHKMSIVDQDGIKLYIGDICVDFFGIEWELVFNKDLLHFKLSGSSGSSMTERLPISESVHLKLKWKRMV